MTWLDLAAFVLAVGAVEDVWFNGTIFAGWRARVELWEGLLGELLTCPFCLSYHIPYLLLAVFYVPVFFVETPWTDAGKFIIYWLAIVRTANILEGLLPERMRYERPFEFKLEEPSMIEDDYPPPEDDDL